MIVLAAIGGVACWLWQVHDLGRSCGYAPGHGLPSFPVVTALAVLVGSPTLILGATSAVLERRLGRATVTFMIGTAVVSGVAFVVASFAFWISRNCFA
jgi:low temperature requirement protein LtrA